MPSTESIAAKITPFIVPGDHDQSRYFEAIKALVAGRDQAEGSERAAWQQAIDEVYALVADEIRNRAGQPLKPVSFGTSGWRGLLGKELFVRSVAVVTAAILSL